MVRLMKKAFYLGFEGIVVFALVGDIKQDFLIA